MILRARKLASAALTASLVTMGGVGTTVLSAGTAHAASCPTASQIVTDIKTITTQAGNLNSQLGSLTTSSSASSVQSTAQSTTVGLNTMTSELAADTGSLNGCPALGASDAQNVANAFDGLTAATNQMLSTLIGKHVIFAQFALTAPIASSLRSLEAGFDSYTFALLAVAPSQQDAITNDKNSGDISLDNAINVYSQLCIPSPLYPIVPPVCASI